MDFVSRFMAKHPGLQVDMTMTNQFVDLVATQVDVAIRFGALGDSSAIAKRLGVSLRVPMASPSYLKERGTPRTPAALEQHASVLFPKQTRGARLAAAKWPAAREGPRPRRAVHQQFGDGARAGVARPRSRDAAGVVRGFDRARPRAAAYLNRKFVPAKLQAFLSELTSWRTRLLRKEQAV